MMSIKGLKFGIPDSYTHYLILLVITVLVMVLGYLFLPLCGVEQLKALLDIKIIWGFLAFIALSIIYLEYLKVVCNNPSPIIGFYIAFMPVLYYIDTLILKQGFSIHLSLLLLALITVPAFLTDPRRLIHVMSKFPYLPYYACFSILILWSYFFHSVQVSSFIIGPNRSSFGDESFSFGKTITTYLFLTTMISLAKMHSGHGQIRAFFHKFNFVLAILIVSYGLFSLLLYHSPDFIWIVEGFPRMKFIFPHPNMFSHYMAHIIIYFTGSYLYYLKESNINPPLLILSALLSATACLFLSMSKTAIIGAVVGVSIIILINAIHTKKIMSTLSMGFKFLIVGLILFLSAHALGLIDISALVAERFQDNRSMDYRLMMWAQVWDSIDISNIWFGQGLSSGNQIMQSLTFSPVNLSKGSGGITGTHNMYLETICDFGLLGYIWLVGVLAFLIKITKKLLLSAVSSSMLPILSTCLAMSIFFLLQLANDEMFYTVLNPYWHLVTVLYAFYLTAQEDSNNRVEEVTI